MTRRRFGLRLILALTILVAPLAGEAQQAVKVPRIGVLSLSSPSDPAMPRRLEAFGQGLRALGWVEGQNITVERRYAEGDSDRLPTLATELVRVPVELMVTLGLPAAHAAIQGPTGGNLRSDPIGSCANCGGP